MPAFSQGLFDAICDRIADGESLRTICADDGMPAKGTVLRWLSEKPELQDQYARAREKQADAIFDEILTIADGATAETVQAARLRVDARKWMAGKLRPKVYGDRLDMNHSGNFSVTLESDVSRL